MGFVDISNFQKYFNIHTDFIVCCSLSTEIKISFIIFFSSVYIKLDDFNMFQAGGGEDQGDFPANIKKVYIAPPPFFCQKLSEFSILVIFQSPNFYQYGVWLYGVREVRAGLHLDIKIFLLHLFIHYFPFTQN